MTELRDYNTVTKACAQRCQKVRQAIEAGIGPGNIVSEACRASGILYGGCRSEAGPDVNDDQQKCRLPIESAQAVDAYAAGVRTALGRMGATMAVRELRTVASGEV